MLLWKLVHREIIYSTYKKRNQTHRKRTLAVIMLRRSTNASLKEKLQEHYRSRDFTPRVTSASKVGLTTTGVLIFLLFLESLVVLLPGVYAAQEKDGEVEARSGWLGEGYWLTLVVVVLSWVEVTWNWWRTYYDVPNWVTKEMKAAHFGQMLETPPGECLLQLLPCSIIYPVLPVFIIFIIVYFVLLIFFIYF